MTENTDGSKQIDNLFAKPAFLSTIPIPRLAIDEYEDSQISDQYVKLSFDVSMYGKARNIRIIDESSMVDSRFKQRAVRYIRWSRFRPRIVAGKPVATRRMEISLPATLLTNGADGKFFISSPASVEQ